MNNVIAIIPARSGSKSILDKNIANLSGHPLLAYSIAVAKLSKKISRVIVSTNSRKYADIAIKYGAEVPFIRPEKYSNDFSTDKEFLLHAMNWFKANEQNIPQFWVHLRPSTPLRDPIIVDKAIDIILDKNATSLRSGHKAVESPLKWFSLSKEGFFQSFISDDNNQEAYNLPKESFDDVYIPNGYVDIVKASHIMNNSTVHGERMIGYESPFCTEVDSNHELDYIKYEIEKKSSVLLNYLDKLNK